MFTRGGTIRRWAALWVLAAGALFASAAQANTFADTCTSCHATNATSPPFMPSQEATFGKIMKEGAHFTDECLVTTNCVLRQRLKGEDAMGNIINVNARNNMLGLAGSFTNAELETVRLYLLKVRNLVIANPSPTFSFPSTLTTNNSSIASAVAIQNWRGTSVSYSFSLVAANLGEHPGDYSITAGSSGSCAGTTSLGTPNNCNANVTVQFSPTAGGSRPATLRMTFSVNAADPIPFTRDFSLTGTGVVPAPIYQASTNALNFTARLGSSVTNSMTITNGAGATANLVLSAFNYSAPQYTRVSGIGLCGIGTSLAAGASCTLTTTFSPSAAGAQNGSLSIVHNAAGSPNVVTLTGAGTQSLISTSPVSSLPFGSVQQGVPKSLPLVVNNTGSATLNFTVSPSSPAALTGPDAADYSVTGCPLPLNPLVGTCTLTVTLTPSALLPRSATLTISSDATNGPLLITLTGIGVALPEPVVTPPASDFPDTVINQTSAQTRTVTIQNNRTTTVTYAVSDTTDFKIGSESCPTRVVPGAVGGVGGVCTIEVEFSPTLGAGEGRRTAALAFSFTGATPPNPDPVNVAVAGNALLPLGQSATSLDAAAVVGSPTTTSMLLTNRSSSPITLTSLLFSGAAATDYSLAAGNTCTPTLVLGGVAPPTPSSCTLVVGFNPPAAGTRNATLTLTHTAVGSPQTVALLGAATPAPQGRIELSSSTVSYADTQLASTSAQTITVRNGGNLALNFSAFTFGGTNPGDFQQSGTCAVGVPLPIAADCTLILTFAPTALGLRAATLSIPSDASNGTAVITLSGTGVPIPAPKVSLTPTTLDFGTQTIGGLYPARRIRLANSGTADLTIGSITATGTGFAIATSTCAGVLAPAAGCDIDVAFTPAAAQAYSGALTVVSNAAGSPHATVLRGSGSVAAVPVLVFSPAVTTLDFGSVSAGSVSAAQTVTVLNQGPGGATLTLLNAIGGDAASFSVVGGTCAIGTVLFEAASCTISIQFAPGSAGTKTAQVQIASTGSFPPVLTLTGVGLAGPNPSLALSTAALAFEDTRVDSQSLPSTVRISSSGSGVVTISAIAVTGPYGIDSTTCPAVPFSLPAGTECTVSVSFRPTDKGAAPGTLSVTSDAAPAVREVALSGSGESKVDTSSGGCTIGDPRAPADPLLWTMVLIAAIGLFARQRQRKRAPPQAARKEPLN